MKNAFPFPRKSHIPCITLPYRTGGWSWLQRQQTAPASSYCKSSWQSSSAGETGISSYINQMLYNCAVHIIACVIAWKSLKSSVMPASFHLHNCNYMRALLLTFTVHTAFNQQWLKLSEMFSVGLENTELTGRADQQGETEKFPVPVASSGRLWSSSRRQTPADLVHQTLKCDAFSLLASSSHSSVVSLHVHPWNHTWIQTYKQLNTTLLQPFHCEILEG